MPHLSPLTSHLSPRPSAWLHNPNLSLWLAVDPLSDKYPGSSPYVYCGNNPVRLVDVDGREMAENLDWVRDNTTGEFIWRDDVTSANNTPDGCTYVGHNDNDILQCLNIRSSYSSQTFKNGGIGIKGVLGWFGVAVNVASGKGHADLSVRAVSGNSVKYQDGNNKNGRYFKGIEFVSYVNQQQISGSKSTQMFEAGHLSIDVGDIGKCRTSGYYKITNEAIIAQQGTVTTKARVFIPAHAIFPKTVFYSATCSLGDTNTELLLRSKPPKLNWNLMITSIIKQMP